MGRALKSRLQLAGKAAGYNLKFWPISSKVPDRGTFYLNDRPWRPHESVTDAFFLARTLGMQLHFDDVKPMACMDSKRITIVKLSAEYNNASVRAMLDAILDYAVESAL